MKENFLQKWLQTQLRCSEYRVGLWECPQFLFVIMGLVIVVAILVTYQVARAYADPALVIILVSALTGFLLIIGNLIVSAFDRVARSVQSKSDFISIMSHQLRAPLSGIKWQLDALHAELTRDGAARISEKPQHYIEIINAQNERMIRSVNDLLLVNHIEDNDLLLRPSLWSIGALTRKLIDHYRLFASANNVSISLLCQEPGPAVYADEERAKSVIEHLIDNAIRYSIYGGNITITIEEKNNRVIWKIADEGVGIPEEDGERVFEKFYRARNAVRYQTEGSGVGLFIAKTIITLSGGVIHFISQPHKGSIFWFSLPANKLFA